MVLMAFRSNAFKEYILKNGDSSISRIYIDKEVFRLKRGFYLKFEVIDHSWSVIADPLAYEIISHKNSVNRVKLTGRDLINIKTIDGVIIKCLTFADETAMTLFDKFDLTGVSEITIGKFQDNTICYDFENLVSKLHCKIVCEHKKHILYDFSSNGVYVNSKRISGATELSFGDVVEIFGIKLLYLNNILAVSSVTGKHRVSDRLKRYSEFTVDENSVRVRHRDYYFNRSPRRFPAICTEQIVVEAPTNPQLTKKKSLLLTIGPSLTMAIPMILGCSLMIISMMMSGNNSSTFMYTGLITAFGSAVLGALWAFLNLREADRRELEDENQRFNLYSNYLLQISDYVKEKYQQNRDALYTLYPSAGECCAYTDSSTQLWSRNMSHGDFLFHRLGLGDIDFQMGISIPTEKFSMTYDSLKDKPKMLYDNFKVLSNVPVGVDFSQNSLYGIVGGKGKKGAYSVVDNLIAQITATTCYTDAKIVFFSNCKKHKSDSHWEYVKWFPHVWSENKDIRYYATNKQEISDVLFELSNIIRQRAEVVASSHTKPLLRPHYFLFVTDLRLLDDELICKYIFDKNADYGITTFLITDDYRSLPNSCEDIIQNDEHFSGYYNLSKSFDSATPIVFDNVSREELLSFAKRISGVKVKEVEDDTSIVSSLTFFEMYNAGRLSDFNIIEQWRKNKTNSSIKALIGKKAGYVNCYLDIHEKHHGPHGLIAGTTGSGKSEIIQTFILSLAINYSPDDIAFFIIDFKGGGMANLFSGLPHMAGQISNLSGNQISRAMISIKSENLRRQRIFNEYGVNNINLYTQLYKSGKATVPIPHLLIIIDEFAELKKEEPEFMRELISVAQVGRSLGVHLILATQKPNGTVDDNIWSNAKFRLCLRVQDRQDSNDMLHKPDAAYITQAGRCYLQVGNDEIYELFQSGYSGAVYDENADAVKSDIATMITPTGKTALVGSHTKMKIKEQERNNWYSFLYRTICSLRDKEFSRIGSVYDVSHCKDDLPQMVINAAVDNGYNIGMSNSELCTVQNFIDCMPDSNMSEKQAVEYINMRAVSENIRLPELKEKTQLEALVGYIAQVADKHSYVQKSQLWMPLLKSEIELKEVVDIRQMYKNGKWQSNDAWSLNAVVGLYDDPHNQTQLPFKVDFVQGGHLAVCGMVSSGKSTFLQTLFFSLAVKYSPEDVNFYFLDFSSGMLSVFNKLPHTGGVIKENDLEKTAKFFNMIASVIAQRKKKIEGGNFVQYKKTHKDEKMPAIIIAIDNFASFKEKTENAYESLIVQLSREGVGYGVYLVCTSAGFGMAEIQNRIGDNFRTVISLEMGDKFKYMDVLRTTRIEVLPESGVKGRGVALIENRLLEFQTAVAVAANNDYERNTVIEKICESMSESYSGKRAKPIPHIPENPTYEDIAQLEEYSTKNNSNQFVPYAFNNEDAAVYSVELERTFCYSITGKARTGKTNVLKLLLLSCVKKDADIVVIEKSLNELKGFSSKNDIKYISSDFDILEYFKQITPDFIERNKYKNELLESGLSDEEIFVKMQKYKPIYIFVSDLIEFIDSVYHPQDNVGNMSGFFENIFEKGYLHNIYFFACINVDEVSSVAGKKAYHSFVSYKTGVHLGGNTAVQRIFNFQNIHYSQMNKPSKKGEGLVPYGNDDTIAQKVIIPLVEGTAI